MDDVGAGPRACPARFRIAVEASEAGTRLDRYLTARLGWPLGLAQKAIRKGWVRVDGHRARAADHLRPGAELRLTRPGLTAAASGHTAPTTPPPPQQLLDQARAAIRFASPDLIVAAKPAGLPTHSGTGHPHGLLELLAATTAATFLAPIGRLDRDASGLLLFARSRDVARVLDQALRGGLVARRYSALVLGTPRPGPITLPLQTKAGPAHRERTRVADDGKKSLTLIHAVRPLGAASLIEVEIETGRTHQIRAHLAALGHPLLGDPRYGTPAAQALSRAIALPRLFLHAGTLQFPDGLERVFIEPLPAELASSLARL